MNVELENYTIAFVINSMNVGGAAKMVRYVANFSSDYFKKVYFITLYDKTPDEELDERIESVNLGIRLDINKIRRRILTVFEIRKAIKRINPTITCAFVSDVAYMSRLATIGLPTIFASAERGNPASEKLYSKILVKWAYNKSNACFFQLPDARDYFGNCIREKSFVIPNAFPRSFLVEPNFKERKKTIVSAGRFTIQKGYDVLIEAFKIVHKLHPDYRLILYGEGVLHNQYLEQIFNCGLEGYVDFPGYCKNIPSTIQNDGIFVLSSRWEGIPNSMIEAMSVGIPVVACDCPPGGPKFLSHGGERAIVIPMNDAKAMACAINKLIDAPEEAISMAKRGMRVVDDLDEIVIGNKWIEAFKKIVNRYE